jgi:cytochrome c553
MIRSLASVAALAGLMTLPVAAQEAKLVQAGKAIYAAEECDRCHMIAGKGHKDAKLDGVASRLSADELRKWLTAPRDMEATLDHTPKVKMSSRKDMHLTDDDVTALVAYLGTLK